MLDLIIALVAGILLGFFFRNRKHFNLEKITLLAILALIFSLGFKIGSNKDLLAAMSRVGVNALLVSFLTIIFSIAFSELARKAVGMK